MNYLISEDEYNRLHSVQCQLNMMGSLFCGMEGFETPCKPSDLAEFFYSQESTLDAVRKAVDHRSKVAATEDKPMHWFDWLSVMEIASGDNVPLHPGRVQYIDDALSHMATLDPAYEMLVKKWVEVSGRYARKQAGKDQITEAMQSAEPSGHLSVELFAKVMHAVSGQVMELDELNETVGQFLAAFDEQHPERAVIQQALNHALLHNGYEWSLTVNQGGQHSKWVRKAEATAAAPKSSKKRKRERMINSDAAQPAQTPAHEAAV